MTEIEKARKIMGKNIIGPEELKVVPRLAVQIPASVSLVPYDANLLKRLSESHLLIFFTREHADGSPLTIMSLRSRFGIDPEASEPCFYNQDWYIREDFATKAMLKNRWYLIRKDVDPKSRAKLPEDIKKSFSLNEKFPSAILTAYAFFAYHLLTGKKIWEDDFVWTSDADHNGDRIYVGRYKDLEGVNKNGFNIHRHLRIRKMYGAAPLLQ